MSIDALAQVVNSPPPPTPCIGVCEMDAKTNLCLGCARNGDEITCWQDADDADKSAIWGVLPERRSRLDLNVYRLPWSADNIYAMVERTLRRRWGRWVLGIEGASAGFEILPGEDADVYSTADAISAITAHGAIRLMRHEKTIAIAFGSAANEHGPDAIGLILPRGRIGLRSNDVLTALGEDHGAIALSQTSAPLYDLGIASHSSARFCLRCTDDAVAAKLALHAGRPWTELMDCDSAVADQAALHSVVETGLGRIESFASPGFNQTCCSYAHLDRDCAKTMNELPEGWALKPVFAPCAMFYPTSRRPANALVNGPF